MNPVSAAFVSLTSAPASGDEAAYLRWHLLDHLPEQYSIPGIRLGTRWRADDDCVELRLAASERLAPARHAVAYLLTEPLDETLTEFVRLARRLREAGRYPEPAIPHLLGAYELDGAWVAPSAVVSAEAVPFRAHRGVYLLVERPGPTATTPEGIATLVATDGVAGAWSFHAGPRLGADATQGERYGIAAWDPQGYRVTILYLDGDVLVTSERLAPRLRERWARDDVVPDLAGPFRSMVAYEAWPPGS